MPASLSVLWKMATPRRYIDKDYMGKVAPDIYGGAFRRDPSAIASHADAIHGARKTLRKFLVLAKNPGPTMGGFSVKIAIPAANGAEFFWIHPFAHVDDRFIGQINNTPRSAVNLKMGDTVSFVKNEIVKIRPQAGVDWR